MLETARRELDIQLNSADALDSKAVGLLSADAVLFGLLGLLVQTLVKNKWWIPGLALLLSSALAAVSLLGRTYKTGPKLIDFYQGMQQATEAEANMAMALLFDGYRKQNQGILVQKGWLFGLSVGFLLLAAISAAILSAMG